MLNIEFDSNGKLIKNAIKSLNCQTQSSIDPIQEGLSCQTIKLREFQRNIKNYLNGNYYVVDGKGKIVLTVYQGKHLESVGGLTCEENQTLFNLYDKVESLEKAIRSKLDY